MKPNFANRTIWTGDNLYILRGMNSESVDLIYLDPPFNSKTNYAAPIGSKAAGAAFKDTWNLSDLDVEWINLLDKKNQAVLRRVLLAAMTPSDKSYLVYMAVRLLEMRRVLKPTGSLYLHCDPTMGHYLKLLMDSMFGKGQFRNEIVWEAIQLPCGCPPVWSDQRPHLLLFQKPGLYLQSGSGSVLKEVHKREVYASGRPSAVSSLRLDSSIRPGACLRVSWRDSGMEAY